MKTLKATPLLLLACVLSPSCAKKKDDVKALPVVVAPLTGDYSLGCQNDVGGSLLKTLRFNETQMMIRSENFAAQNCPAASKSFTVDLYNDYKLGAKRADGSQEFDFTESRVELTAESQARANDWSLQGKCGLNHWNMGEPTPIRRSSGCLNDQVPDGRKMYSVLRVDGNRLFFGAPSNREQDGLAPERRLVGFEEQAYLKTSSAACPALAGTYACTQGDPLYAGRNAVITMSGPDTAPQFRLVFTRAGMETTELQLLPNTPERRALNRSGLMQIDAESCFAGQLISTSTVQPENNPASRVVAEQVFRLDDRKSVVITSTRQSYAGDRPDRKTQDHTECVKIN